MSFAPSFLPVTFSGCHGLVSLPNPRYRRNCAVLMLRPWGFDELCTRKFFKQIADKLAEAGIASLRFDYPGTVDAADPEGGQNLSNWTAASQAGLKVLHNTTGCDEIILFGFGLGSVIAQQIMETPGVSGIIHAAPVTNPKRYLRETSLRAKVIIEGLGLPEDALPKETISIAGLNLDAQLVEDLKSYQQRETIGNLPSLILARPGLEADARLSATLRKCNDHSSEFPFTGYEQLLEDPTSSRIPEDVLRKIVSWCHARSSPAGPTPLSTGLHETVLEAEDFSEETVLLGANNSLFGIACTPKEASHNAPVFIFLNSGYDHHGGWARAWVDGARRLAAKGAISLRADFANIGDSAPTAGEPEQVLYTDGPIHDTKSFVDFAKTRSSGPVILVGRCSGAYTAFQAAYKDERISRLVLCNQVRLIWDPEESLTDPARMGPRSMGDYKKRAADPRTLIRLFKGEISIPGVMRGLTSHAITRLSHLLAPIFPKLTKHARFRSECHQMFRAFRKRRTFMHFVCSDGDQSLEQLALYFGKGQKGLKAYPNVSLQILPDADHNLTPVAARDSLFALLERLATTSPRR